MANERLVRANFQAGTIITTALTTSSTTITSTALASLPAVDSTAQYCKIILDPAAVNGAPEVVHITAHTASSTSATIVRAKEGTTARAHPIGEVWVHAPTTQDFPVTVDTPWGGDTTYDYEFDGYQAAGSTLPSGWSWVNQGTTTYREEFGSGVLLSPTQSTENHRSIVRSLPSPSTWDLTAKFAGPVTTVNYLHWGLILRQSSNGKECWLRIANDTGIAVSTYDDAAGTNGASYTSAGVYQAAQYLRISRTAATTYSFSTSPDGMAWESVLTGQDVSAKLTPDQVGFGIMSKTGTITGGIPLSCHWFRVR